METYFVIIAHNATVNGVFFPGDSGVWEGDSYPGDGMVHCTLKNYQADYVRVEKRHRLKD